MKLRKFIREFDPADPVRGAFLPEDPATVPGPGCRPHAPGQEWEAMRAGCASSPVRPRPIDGW